MIIDFTEIETCFICEENHECTQGSEVIALDAEWVCDECQSDAEKVAKTFLETDN